MARALRKVLIPALGKEIMMGVSWLFSSFFSPSLKLLKTYPLIAEGNASWFSVHITKSGSRKSGTGIMHLRGDQASVSASVSHQHV